MFSIASCLGLFVLEAVYILAFYDAAETKVQAGLTLIFALEASFMVKIIQSNLEQEKTLGKVSRSARLYSAFAMLPLLVLIALAEGPISFKQYSWAWIALFAASAGGKVIWRKRMVQMASHAAMAENHSN